MTAFPEAKKCVTCNARGRILIEFRAQRKPYWKNCPMCAGLGWETLPWLRFREPGGPIDCVIIMARHGWYTTACGIWTPNGTVVDAGKRRCRKCVAEMKRIAALPPIRAEAENLVAKSEVG